jgi:hypothetical protein
MADDDRSLRALYADTAAAPPPGHPDEEAWEALAVGELPESRKQELVAHVVRCADCAAVYRGVTMLHEEAPLFDSAVPSPRPARVLPWPRKWIYTGLATAAAVLLVTLLPLSRRGTVLAPAAPPSDDRLRSGESAVPVALEPQGSLNAPPARFRWQGIARAARYRVDLSNGAGELLWASSPVDTTSVDWPASVRVEAGVYYWQVTALPAADGRTTPPVPSPLVSFEIVPAR